MGGARGAPVVGEGEIIPYSQENHSAGLCGDRRQPDRRSPHCNLEVPQRGYRGRRDVLGVSFVVLVRGERVEIPEAPTGVPGVKFLVHGYTLAVPEVVTDAERQFVKRIADQAMISSWDQAIGDAAREEGLTYEQVVLTLNRVSDYNDKADPSGRIEELEDWEKEKLGRSTRAASRGPGKTPQAFPKPSPGRARSSSEKESRRGRT